MKSFLLAAAAIIAVPAIAQDTPAASSAGDPTAQTMPSDPAAPTTSDPTSTTPAVPSGATPPAADPTATSGTTTATPAAPESAEAASKAGGYQPSQPALSGQLAPGQTAQFVQPQSPDQAFPAPAPKQSYPVCKKGQYDGCRQARSPK